MRVHREGGRARVPTPPGGVRMSSPIGHGRVKGIQRAAKQGAPRPRQGDRSMFSVWRVLVDRVFTPKNGPVPERRVNGYPPENPGPLGAGSEMGFNKNRRLGASATKKLPKSGAFRPKRKSERWDGRRGRDPRLVLRPTHSATPETTKKKVSVTRVKP